jgi:hypothetical protein
MSRLEETFMQRPIGSLSIIGFSRGAHRRRYANSAPSAADAPFDGTYRFISLSSDPRGKERPDRRHDRTGD